MRKGATFGGFAYRPGAVEWVCFLWLALLLLAVLIGPWAMHWHTGTPWDEQNLSSRLSMPSFQHPLGTDILGRDMLSRLLMAARVSLGIGLCASAVAFVIGVSVGSLAGYSGGLVDLVLMRIVEGFYSLPYIIVAAVIMSLFRGNVLWLTLTIGAVSWLTMARVVRAQVIDISQKAYVDAAKLMGLSRFKILIRHILPNALDVMIVYATLATPSIILSESFLSFLGLGVSPPLVSLGVAVQEGVQSMAVAPAMLFEPGIILGLTFFSLNILGESMRDAVRAGARQL
jgi:oligopeptide transport system permease protein